MSVRELLREFIILERKLRETDDVELAVGKSVKYGSDAYVNDLKRRIEELELWRSHQDRGSEARANYSRLLGRLKNELRSLNLKREKQANRGEIDTR